MLLKKIIENRVLLNWLRPALLLLVAGCNKLVQVPGPISSVTTHVVFSADADATAAMLGIYSNMNSFQPSFSNLYTTYYPGESADELSDEIPGNESQDNFLSNTLASQSSNEGSNVSGYFWQPAYYAIYEANAIISGVQASTGMSEAAKIELAGEAKFIRAFSYFYLTNLFGDLPLDTNINFNQTVLLPRTPQAQIYQQIVSDLLDAQSSLPADFSLTNGQPIRANKWAATALLARVYLYLPHPNYVSADSAASAVINSGQFSLVPLPVVPEVPDVPPGVFPDSDAFFANSPEAILQLQSLNYYPFGTIEGYEFVPNCTGCSSTSNCFLSSQLLGAFEPNDLRRLNWVDSTNAFGWYEYYPFKYKIAVGPGYPSSENYTLLRFAEQYLIRAEAEVNLGDMANAAKDLNTIRTRAGLGPSPTLTASSTLEQADSAIQQENRIEFFAEWGHRWFDLKRWGIAIQTLDTISYKVGIKSYQLLYPIPLGEIQDDPNLKQNPGYQP
jgi:starch-binding outer membrane protein, SusD/RagB family